MTGWNSALPIRETSHHAIAVSHPLPLCTAKHLHAALNRYRELLLCEAQTIAAACLYAHGMLDNPRPSLIPGCCADNDAMAGHINTFIHGSAWHPNAIVDSNQHLFPSFIGTCSA
jgi:hypothetical protein